MEAHILLNVFLFFTFVLCLTLLPILKRRRLKDFTEIPGPPNLPLPCFDLVMTLLLGLKLKYHKNIRGDILKSLTYLKQCYGDVYRGYLGDGPVVFLNSYKSAAVLLRSAETDKGKEYDLFRDLIGDGVFSANGNLWKHRRKMLNPSFSNVHIGKLQPVFKKHAKILSQVLNEVADKPQYFDFEPLLISCFLDIIVESLIQKDAETQLHPNSELLHAMECLMLDVTDRIWKPWLRSKFIWSITGRAKSEERNWAVVKQVINSEIEEQRRIKDTNSHHKPNDGTQSSYFIDILLNNPELSTEEIIQEAMSMIAGARDTSTRATLFTLFLLANNPGGQRKVQQEIDNFLQNPDDFENMAEIIDQLTHLECCIKESLRLFPPVAAFGRLLKENLHLENGMLIPKGTSCIVVPPIIHRDPKIYPEPEEFNPSRFLDDTTIDPYNYVAFSAGRRNCPGKKFGINAIKTVLVYILANFYVTCAQSRNDVQMTIDILLKPSRPFQFLLKKRANSNSLSNL